MPHPLFAYIISLFVSEKGTKKFQTKQAFKDKLKKKKKLSIIYSLTNMLYITLCQGIGYMGTVFIIISVNEIDAFRFQQSKRSFSFKLVVVDADERRLLFFWLNGLELLLTMSPLRFCFSAKLDGLVSDMKLCLILLVKILVFEK